jgi:hypothetical protein
MAPFPLSKRKYESEDESIPKEIIERRKNCKGPAIFIVLQKEGEKKSPPRNVSSVMPGQIGGAPAVTIIFA